MKRPLLFSVALHLSMLVLLYRCGGGATSSKGPNEPGQPDTSEIVPKPQEVIEVSPVNEAGLKKLQSSRKVSKKDTCGEFYGGVGVYLTLSVGSPQSGMMWMVGEVVEGYPADLAGIKTGDMLFTDTDLRGDVGSEVVVRVVHPDHTETSHVITRAKICTKNPREKPQP